MAAPSWSLTDAERADTVTRLAANIATLGFFKGKEFDEAQARAAASAIEKKAYTAAQVSARTTTGDRPKEETTSGYARCAHAQAASWLPSSPHPTVACAVALVAAAAMRHRGGMGRGLTATARLPHPSYTSRGSHP